MDVATIHKSSALLSASSFLVTLYVGLFTHYTDHVKTHVAKYPEEWFASVSAVIGDFYPARSIFQIGLALTATFRFLSIHNSHQVTGDDIAYFFDILKTLSIGGMAYITSSDDMNVHSASMIVYVIGTLGSMWRRSRETSQLCPPYKLAQCLFGAYVSTLGLMGWNLYRHNVQTIPGAYSWYAVFEWMLPGIDIIFDYITSMNGYSQVYTQTMMASAKDTLRIVPSLWSAIVFWTNVTGLPLSLWYFPLWKLGLSGYEVSLVAYLAPILLSNARVRGFIMRNAEVVAILTAHGILFGRVESFSPQTRLIMISFATAMSMMQWFVRLGESSPLRDQHRHTFVQGLIYTVALKWVNYSINPLWNTVRWEFAPIVGLGIFHVVMSFDLFMVMPPSVDKKKYLQPPQQTSFMKSVAFGASLFLTHSFVTDASTFMMRSRPPAPEGEIMLPFVAIIMMFSGNYLDPEIVHILSPLFFALCHLTPTGIRSLDVSKWMMTHMVVIQTNLYNLDGIIKSPLHVTVALSTYLAYLFADVFTVGYAFVPFGWIFRERVAVVFFSACTLQLIPLFIKKSPDSVKLTSTDPRLKKFLPLERILMLGLGLSACIQGHLQQNREKLSFKEIHDKNVLTAGIWTSHFALRDDMYLSHDNMTNLIQKLDLDVIGILESDTMRNVGGNRNLLQYIASRLNMETVYGPVPTDSTWGCSLLSRYPVLNSTTYLLPSPVGELACAIHATIQTPHMIVDVFVSHNGQEEDLEDRKLQTREIARILDSVDRPVIFLGYLVTKPGIDQPIYNMMIKDARMKDILETDRKRWCEYVFYRDLLPLAYARITHGKVTDTELQSAKFWIGANTTFIQMNDHNMYSRDFEGDGWRDHRYNIFSGAIYDPVSYDAQRQKLGM